jgi:ABC-type multidrug transport system ATPase subunit
VFRKFQLSKNEMLSKLELDKHLDKPIKFFSSGMKQKTRLLLAILDCAPVLLLDEPLSNLDENNAQWYSEMIQEFAMNKTILVFSNSLEKEYFFCDKYFSLS